MPISTRHDPFPVQDPYHGIYAHGVETRAGAKTLHISGQYGESTEGHQLAPPTGYSHIVKIRGRQIMYSPGKLYWISKGISWQQ